MRLILKLADYLDTSKVGGDSDEDDDEDFEDCEDMDDDDEADQAQVIDLDAQKQNCMQVVFSFLDHILLRTQPIP